MKAESGQGVLLLYFICVAWGHRKDQLLKDVTKYEEFKIKETQDLFVEYKRHLQDQNRRNAAGRPSTPSDIQIATPEKPPQVRKAPSWPRSWTNFSLLSMYIPTGMRGPTCASFGPS